MITPLKKQPGHHGLIAVLMLAATTVVVWTARPRTTRLTTAIKPTIQRITSPGAAMTTPDRVPAVEQPTKPVVVDDRSPLIATGFTSYDETRTAHVGVPVAGWMRKTRASSLGRSVRAGETVAIIYSPEVYLTTASVVEQVRDFHGQESLDADRYRLLRWGMQRPTLARIEKTLTPQAALPLVARVPGIVVAEAGAPAQLVEPGLELFTITDPTYSWVFVDVPDAVAARLAVGTPALVAIEGNERPVTAKVAYVYRYSEDGMRKARFEIHGSRPVKPGLAVKAEFRLAK